MIKVVQPPKNDDDIPVIGRWLFEGYKELGMALDIQGFVMAWTSGSTKMVVDVDEDNKIIGGALMATGKKWTDSLDSATILQLKGNRAKLLDYCVNLATAFNMAYLAYEAEEGEPGVLSRVHRVDM